jgi:hypothetical protein
MEPRARNAEGKAPQPHPHLVSTPIGPAQSRPKNARVDSQKQVFPSSPPRSPNGRIHWPQRGSQIATIFDAANCERLPQTDSRPKAENCQKDPPQLSSFPMFQEVLKNSVKCLQDDATDQPTISSPMPLQRRVHSETTNPNVNRRR